MEHSETTAELWGWAVVKNSAQDLMRSFISGCLRDFFCGISAFLRTFLAVTSASAHAIDRNWTEHPCRMIRNELKRLHSMIANHRLASSALRDDGQPINADKMILIMCDERYA